MSDENSFGSFLKQRSVLGDLSTNRNGKRGFPLSHGSFTLEKGKAHRKNIEGDEKGKLPSWVYIGLENSDKGKENVSPENAADTVDKSLPFLKTKRACRSLDPENDTALSQETVASDESKEVLSSLNGELNPVSGDTVILGTIEGEGSRDSCISSSSAHAKSGKAGEPSPVFENQNPSGTDGAKERSVSHAFGRSEIENYGQFFALGASNYECMDSHLSSMFVDAIPSQESVNNSGSTVPSGSNVADAIPIQESLNNSSSTVPSGSKGAELHFNANINSQGGFSTNDGLHLETACSCSFCMKGISSYAVKILSVCPIGINLGLSECYSSWVLGVMLELDNLFANIFLAAYLWLDLHYQDLKGRLAALSKSMRHARLLVRNYSHDDIQRVGRGGSNSKLEFDLMNQWKSLFHHTEDILVCESAQLIGANVFNLSRLAVSVLPSTVGPSSVSGPMSIAYRGDNASAKSQICRQYL
ncbi:hypothetical protein ACLOJK_016216 [Asimina triloba]